MLIEIVALERAGANQGLDQRHAGLTQIPGLSEEIAGRRRDGVAANRFGR